MSKKPEKMTVMDDYGWSPEQPALENLSGHVETIRVPNFVYIHPPVLEICKKKPEK